MHSKITKSKTILVTNNDADVLVEIHNGMHLHIVPAFTEREINQGKQTDKFCFKSVWSEQTISKWRDIIEAIKISLDIAEQEINNKEWGQIELTPPFPVKNYGSRKIQKPSRPRQSKSRRMEKSSTANSKRKSKSD